MFLSMTVSSGGCFVFWGGAAYAELVHACAVLPGIPRKTSQPRTHERVWITPCLWSLAVHAALHMAMEDQEWMCWQVDGEDIDFEAQKRELERLEQARRDRLVAEELQHDLSTDREMSSECLTDPTEIPPPSSHSEALEPPGECREEVAEPALRFKVSDATPGPSSTRSFSPLDTAPSSLPTSVQTDGPLSHYTDCRFTDFDQRLAEQLQEEERLEIERRESDVKSQTERDAELARALQGEEERDRGEGEGEEMEGDIVDQSLEGDRSGEVSNIDEQVAHALQQEEEGGGRAEEDVLLAQRLQGEESELLKLAERDEQLAHALQGEQEQVPKADTSQDEELARQIAAQFEATPLSSTTTTTTETSSQGLLAPPPNWWTLCPNCPPDSNRRFHLIEIGRGENEWLSITSPLEDAGFVPQRLLRVQSMKLYRRLQFEKQTMSEEGTPHNEMLLYHTSSASVEAICGEGLDQRLSRKGRFGNGVYFR